MFVSIFPLQESSCEKWKSSENKRLSMSESGTMWPPSSHGELLWSTLTRRMSRSLMKGIGWNDRGHWGKKESLWWLLIKRVQVPPTTDAPLLTVLWRGAFWSLIFSVFLVYLIISLSCCRLCSVERLHFAVIGLIIVSRVSLLFWPSFISVISLYLVNLVMTFKGWGKRHFGEPFCFLLFICSVMLGKNSEGKTKACFMHQFSNIIKSPGGSIWHWVNAAFVLVAFIVLKHKLIYKASSF